MKKSHHLIYLLLTTFFVFSSCQENAILNEETNLFEINLLSNQEKVTSLQSYVSSQLANSRMLAIYDWDNVKQLINEDIEGQVAFAVPEIGSKNRFLGIYESNGELLNSLVVEIQNNSSTKVIFNYYSVDGDTLLGIELDDDIGTVSFVNLSTSGRVACGQETMNCFLGVYENSGWASVGLVLLSIVEPAIAVGVMGGCAAAACY